MKRVLIDMDGVLADFYGELHSLFPELHKLQNGTQEKGDLIDFLIVNKARDIFDHLKPMPGAVDAYKFLCQHYDVHIVSTAMWILPESFTSKRNWVEKHLGEYAYKRLTLTHHKGYFEGDYLIDDRIKNGVAEFKGEHIHFGQPEFPDWHKVLEYLTIKDELYLKAS